MAIQENSSTSSTGNNTKRKVERGREANLVRHTQPAKWTDLETNHPGLYITHPLGTEFG